MQTSDPQYSTTTGTATPRRDRALRIGVIFGVILFITSLLISAIFRALDLPQVGGITNFFAQIIILMIAGAIAARRFTSSALSGLVTALVSTVLGLIAAALGLSNTNLLNSAQQQTGATEGQVAAVLGTAAILLLIVSALLGALFGWLGGKLFGRDRADSTHRT